MSNIMNSPMGICCPYLREYSTTEESESSSQATPERARFKRFGSSEDFSSDGGSSQIMKKHRMELYQISSYTDDVEDDYREEDPFTKMNAYCCRAFQLYSDVKTYESKCQEVKDIRVMLEKGAGAWGPLSKKQIRILKKNLRNLNQDLEKFGNNGSKCLMEVQYSHGNLETNFKHKVHFPFFQRRNAKSREAMRVVVEAVKELRRNGKTKFFDEEGKEEELSSLLQAIVETRHGQSLLGHAPKDLKTDFSNLYYEINNWKAAEDKLESALRFYHKSRRDIGNILGNLRDLQKQEIERILKSEEFNGFPLTEKASEFLNAIGLDEIGDLNNAAQPLVNQLILSAEKISKFKLKHELNDEDVQRFLENMELCPYFTAASSEEKNAFVKKILLEKENIASLRKEIENKTEIFLELMGLSGIFNNGMSFDIRFMLIKDLIQNPDTLYIPLETTYNEIDVMKKAFVKLKDNHLPEFVEMKKNTFELIKDKEQREKLNKLILSEGKLYLTIRSGLLFITQRTEHYCDREKLMVRVKCAMPDNGTSLNDNLKKDIWDWSSAFYAVQEAKHLLNKVQDKSGE